MNDVPTSHSVVFTMFGCTNPSLTNGIRPHQLAKSNLKNENIKRHYEEVKKQDFCYFLF